MTTLSIVYKFELGMFRPTNGGNIMVGDDYFFSKGEIFRK